MQGLYTFLVNNKRKWKNQKWRRAGTQSVQKKGEVFALLWLEMRVHVKLHEFLRNNGPQRPSLRRR